MSCYCDDESPSFFNQRIVKTKKSHKCIECGHRIQPGEEYEYTVGKWEGDFSSFATCIPCADLREALNDVGCIRFGELNEEYYAYLETHRFSTPTDIYDLHEAIMVKHKNGVAP